MTGKVLWVQRANSGEGGGGDSVYEQAVVSHLREGAEVEVLELTRDRSVGRRLMRCLLFLVPHDRGSFITRENARRYDHTLAATNYDRVYISHEQLDWLARVGTRPVILIVHNVTSDFVRTIAPNAFLGSILSALYRWYERSVYKRPNVRAVVALSRSDELALTTDVGVSSVALAAPGAPAAVALAGNATLEQEVVLSGSFKWALKRRDLRRFASEYHSLATPFQLTLDSFDTTTSELFPEVEDRYQPSSTKLRFGLVTDRFAAGFKLKVSWNALNNLITLTYADVIGDYQGLPGAGRFIRRIRSAEEIQGILDEFKTQDPLELVDSFQRFKAAVEGRFRWSETASVLQSAGR